MKTAAFQIRWKDERVIFEELIVQGQCSVSNRIFYIFSFNQPIILKLSKKIAIIIQNRFSLPRQPSKSIPASPQSFTGKWKIVFSLSSNSIRSSRLADSLKIQFSNGSLHKFTRNLHRQNPL